MTVLLNPADSQTIRSWQTLGHTCSQAHQLLIRAVRSEEDLLLEITTGLGKSHGLDVFPCSCHSHSGDAHRLCCETHKHRELGCLSTNAYVTSA